MYKLTVAGVEMYPFVFTSVLLPTLLLLTIKSCVWNYIKLLNKNSLRFSFPPTKTKERLSK